MAGAGADASAGDSVLGSLAHPAARSTATTDPPIRTFIPLFAFIVAHLLSMDEAGYRLQATGYRLQATSGHPDVAPS
ncbi:MAG: hypothetical protein KJ066_03860, partial [Acidobacteria bacterium]|nr:hypothetical protein [Acidobacteriota bacterium]